MAMFLMKLFARFLKLRMKLGYRPTAEDLRKQGFTLIEVEGVDPAWLSTPEGLQRSEEIFRRNEDKLRLCESSDGGVLLREIEVDEYR
jgi:hypothetical protein